MAFLPELLIKIYCRLNYCQLITCICAIIDYLLISKCQKDECKKKFKLKMLSIKKQTIKLLLKDAIVV